MVTLRARVLEKTTTTTKPWDMGEYLMVRVSGDICCTNMKYWINIFITYLPRSLYILLRRVAWDISPYYTPYNITRYTLSMRIIITTVIEMVELVETLDGRLNNLSVERVRYVINNLLLWNMETFHSFFVFPLAFGSWQYYRYSWDISSYYTLTRVISLIY